VSEDSVRVWSLGLGNEGDCVHELSCNGNKFYSCAFHPTYASLLVIGCYQASCLCFFLALLYFCFRCLVAQSNGKPNPPRYGFGFEIESYANTYLILHWDRSIMHSSHVQSFTLCLTPLELIKIDLTNWLFWFSSSFYYF